MAGASWRPRIGERVRVRLSTDRACGEAPHSLDEADRLGHVVRMRTTVGGRSHPYFVLLDRPPTRDPLSGWRPSVAARHYAADELEPIGQADAAQCCPDRRRHADRGAQIDIAGGKVRH